jgi:N-methylhydantoinase B
MNVHPAGRPGRRAQPAAREVDPIVLQIVEGTLNSISGNRVRHRAHRAPPMIREAHDYRVGLFDRTAAS